MSNSCISVVTPCFNGIQYLQQALDSVQSIPLSNEWTVEHIVADALSTDGSRHLLEATSHLNLTSEADNGLYDGLNKAITRAKGEFIFWLNVDDRLHPGFLSVARKFLIENPRFDAVIGDTIFIDAAGDTLRESSNNHTGTLSEFSRGSFYHLNAMLIRTRVVKNMGLFNEKYRLGADIDFQIRLAQNKSKIHHLATPSYYFREHDASLTTQRGSTLTVSRELFTVLSHWAAVPSLQEEHRAQFIRAAAKESVRLFKASLSEKVWDSSCLNYFLKHPWHFLHASCALCIGKIR